MEIPFKYQIAELFQASKLLGVKEILKYCWLYLVFFEYPMRSQSVTANLVYHAAEEYY